MGSVLFISISLYVFDDRHKEEEKSSLTGQRGRTSDKFINIRGEEEVCPRSKSCFRK